MPDTMHIIMDMRHLFGKKDGQEGKKPEEEKKGTEGEQPTATDGTQEKAKPVKKPSMKDWDKELKKRLDANAAMDPESRSSEGDIRNQFWKDFFGTFWKPEVAERLCTAHQPCSGHGRRHPHHRMAGLRRDTL